MAYIVTGAATIVTQTIAQLNGYVAGCSEAVVVQMALAGVWHALGYKYDESFYYSASGLSPSTVYSYQARFFDGLTWVYGDEESFSTTAPSVPNPPSDVAATDGTYTDKVVITWTRSVSATGYAVFRVGTNVSGLLGDVATYNHTGAYAPTISPGTPTASAGTVVAHVALRLSGQNANVGSLGSYSVGAVNANGMGDLSTANTGYRGVGTLTYQWQRSAADSNTNFSNISGATTASYNDTGAPADGSGRYYRCYLTAAGAPLQYTAGVRGYRMVAPHYYQTVGSANVTPVGSVNKSITAPHYYVTVGNASVGPVGGSVGQGTTPQLVGEAVIAPTGEATGSAFITPKEQLVGEAIVAPSGVAIGVVASVIIQRTVGEAVVTISGNVIGTVRLPTTLEAENVAGIFNFTGADALEQGATWAKTFIWRDRDGNAVSLSGQTLRMTIRPYYGCSAILASSSTTIAITEPGATGTFLITMTAVNTTALSFIRAVYDIEAESAGVVRRLVKGSITLDREAAT